MSIKQQKQPRQFKTLFDFWTKYWALEPFHINWVQQHLTHINVPKHHELYWENDGQQYVYFVSSGKIARVALSEDNKRNILSIATPCMALMTTTHLHSFTPSVGMIVALCRSEVIRIPYAALKEFEHQEPSIALFNQVLSNKKKRQLIQLRNISYTTQPLERYFLFDKKMPKIRNATTQQEQADLLGISKSSVQKAQKILLKRKNTPK